LRQSQPATVALSAGPREFVTVQSSTDAYGAVGNTREQFGFGASLRDRQAMIASLRMLPPSSFTM